MQRRGCRTQISCCGSDAGVTAALLEDALRSCKSGGTLWIRHICSAPMFCSLGVPLGKPVPTAVTGDGLLITLREERSDLVERGPSWLLRWAFGAAPGASEPCAFPSSPLFIIKTHVKLSVPRSEDSPLGRAVRSALGSVTGPGLE